MEKQPFLIITCATCETRYDVSDMPPGVVAPCPKCRTINDVPDTMDDATIAAEPIRIIPNPPAEACPKGGVRITHPSEMATDEPAEGDFERTQVAQAINAESLSPGPGDPVTAVIPAPRSD